MKSVLKGVFAAVLLLALIFGVKVVYAREAGGGGVAASGTAAAPVQSWKGPDTELLADYGLEPFETTLPVLFIDTKGQRITKENKIWCEVSVLDADPSGAARSVMEPPDSQEAATIKLRGASSYYRFDKQQYRLKFYEEEGTGRAKDVAFLGMGRNSEWVLNGPFLDKTLLRNRLVYGIGREMFEWAPDTRFVEVFVDGAYEGVYLAVEPVSNGASRLRLSEFGLLSGETSYIVKRDRSETEVDPLNVYGKRAGKTNNDLFMEYPSAKKLTDSQRAWIEKDISAFEEALFGDDFADPDIGYAKYIDVDEFADYFILNEAVMNHDAGNLSTYPYKELGGKLRIAIWDYNNCFDNFQWDAEDFDKFYLYDDGWYARLLQDRAFVDRIVERYTVWREGVLSPEEMFDRIDSYTEELGDAVERNYAVWGYSFQTEMLAGEERNPTSYGDAILQLRTAINKRFAFLDEHITDLYANCIN